MCTFHKRRTMFSLSMIIDDHKCITHKPINIIEIGLKYILYHFCVSHGKFIYKMKLKKSLFSITQEFNIIFW